MAESSSVVREPFPITGMTCAACASSVSSALQAADGVASAEVNFANGEAWVAYRPAQIQPKTLQRLLSPLGYGLILEEKDPWAEKSKRDAKALHQAKSNMWGAIVFTLPVFVLGMFFMEWSFTPYLSLACTLPVILIFGRHFFIRAWSQAQHRKANMDTLVALSTGIAFLFSLSNTFFPGWWEGQGLQAHVYYEAVAVIISFICLGKWLEARAKGATSEALKNLIALQPDQVTIVERGEERKVAAREVVAGMQVRVKPGEKVPFDGHVLEGSSSIEESTISGEPIPVEKSTGDAVFAGTINQQGSFIFRAEKVGPATLLGQIITRVREAQGSQAPVQRMVDKIAALFVPIVLVLSFLTFVVWMVWGGEQALSLALLNSISVLVIACPCALGLATPTAIMVGVGIGADHHILIRDAASLEQARQVTAVVLDKTGTITEGKPRVVSVVPPLASWSMKNRSALFSLEQSSEHPLAQAVLAYLGDSPVTSVREFQNHPGKGIAGLVGRATFRVGTWAWLQSKGVQEDKEILAQAMAWEQEANTPVFLAANDQLVGALAIADEIKTTAEMAIRKLQGQGRRVFLLTGDRAATAAAVAKAVGIPDDHVVAQQLPGDKAHFVKKLQTQGEVVAMVGDGVNDAEALALADVSMAMGQGADIVMDVAKITLMSSDPAAIPQALRLSEKTIQGLRQNLFWAFIYNLIGIPIAAGILFPLNGFLLNPMVAGAAMAFSSVSVVLNSLRLRWFKL